MKKIFMIVLIFVVSLLVVTAHGEETFAEAESIIKSKIPCDQLTDEQLESVGDYYMEQMHPGEAHEAMDEMMGGEGSDNLKQMHINMARSFYCGEQGMMTSGMMNTMMGRGMMGSGSMMGSRYNAGMMNMMGYGTMGSTGWFGMSLLWLLYVALAAFVFGIIFWWTYTLITKKKKRK